ncbi:hypothetical protein MAR_007848 [Mya arenaria]|uniref:Uncharacterized protein n=1 Tax=Mya arenaria TaxID=6604 RepID=A0ABY7DV17_MYAAR|nr:hypothetical protein MAR_007848 [Mya arenaria]
MKISKWDFIYVPKPVFCGLSKGQTIAEMNSVTVRTFVDLQEKKCLFRKAFKKDDILLNITFLLQTTIWISYNNEAKPSVRY